MQPVTHSKECLQHASYIVARTQTMLNEPGTEVPLISGTLEWDQVGSRVWVLGGKHQTNWGVEVFKSLVHIDARRASM